MITRRRLIGAAAALAAPLPARAAWPEKPVVIVNGFPGGNADVVARILADEFARKLGHAFVVEQKAGAGGVVAAASVARAAPDGHTLLLMVGGHAVSAALYNKLGFRPVEDFTMIGMITEFPFVIATHAGHAAKNGAELIALARRASEPMLFGTPGNGTGQHMSAELFAAKAGLKFKHVPYRGSGQGVIDLLGQRLDFIVDTPTVVLPLVRDGQLRALAVTGGVRFFALPEIRTLVEAGVDGYETGSWLGLGAPAGLPGEIVTALNRALREVLSEPPMADRLRELGSEVVPGTPEAFKARLESDIAKWTEVVRATGMQKI